MPLDDVPLRALSQIIELPSRPPADVELEKAALDAHGHATRAGDGTGGLAGALERRRINRGHALDLGDPCRRLLGLLHPFLAEVQARPASGQDAASGWGNAVANEQHNGRRRELAGVGHGW